MMQALSVEMNILEGQRKINELFEFVCSNAKEYTAFQMETGILHLVLQIGLIAMNCYFAEKGTGDIGSQLTMDSGITLKRQSQLKNSQYFSIFGKVNVPRTYYWTEGHSGVMPLDAQADIPDRCYSYLLQKFMNILSIRDSFKESNVTLSTLLGLEVSVSRFETVNQESDTDYDDFYKKKELPDSENEGEIQVCQFDGKGVPVIKKEAAKLVARNGKGEKRQKKKEAMVGVSYTVDKNYRTPEEVADNLIYPEKSKKEKEKRINNGENIPVAPKAQNIRRLASLERKKIDIVEEIVNDGKRRNPEGKKPWAIVMDGALSLWSMVASVMFGIDYVGILDIIHVVEYLWKAGNALKGEKNPETTGWVHKQLLSILKGNVGRVIGGLKQSLKKNKLSDSKRESIEEVIRYFENHRQWMKYDEYLKEGFPIGSGVVESTCGHTVKDRMEGSGRRWGITGAESTLLLRSVYTSNDWDEYWIFHMKQESQRLYGDVLNLLDLADDYFSDSKTKKAA
jgi:hypothetical protein